MFDGEIQYCTGCPFYYYNCEREYDICYFDDTGHFEVSDDELHKSCPLEDNDNAPTEGLKEDARRIAEFLDANPTPDPDPRERRMMECPICGGDMHHPFLCEWLWECPHCGKKIKA